MNIKIVSHPHSKYRLALKQISTQQRSFLIRLNVFLVLCPSREIRVSLPGKATAATRAALPILDSVRSIFVCLNNGMAASVWDF